MSARSPGFPKENPAADPTLPNVQVIQALVVLLLDLRVAGLLGEDFIFRSIVYEFVEQVF